MAAGVARVSTHVGPPTTIITPPSSHLLLPGELLISFTLAGRRPMRRFDERGSHIACDCVITQSLSGMEILLQRRVSGGVRCGSNDLLTFNLRPTLDQQAMVAACILFILSCMPTWILSNCF